jgi:hypothetical protein
MALTTVDQGLLGTYAQYTGFKNRLINGAMAVGQRGNVVFTSTNNLYGWVDRWLVSISGSTVSALGYQANGLTSGANATTSGFALQIGNLLTTGATTAAVSQRIEAQNCSDLNSTSVTFSGKVQQTTGSTQTLTIGVSKATAGVNNWSTQSVIGSTTLSVPTGSGWTPFSFTVTLGATDAVNGISVTLGYNSLGAQTNSQLYFADCQLEKGSAATSFDYRDYGRELMMCQRYYYQASPLRGIGIGLNATVARVKAPLPVTMRATPTLTRIGAPNLYNGSVVASLTSVGSNFASVDCIEFDGATSASFASGTCVSFFNNFDGATVAASAEL